MDSQYGGIAKLIENRGELVIQLSSVACLELIRSALIFARDYGIIPATFSDVC